MEYKLPNLVEYDLPLVSIFITSYIKIKHSFLEKIELLCAVLLQTIQTLGEDLLYLK